MSKRHAGVICTIAMALLLSLSAGCNSNSKSKSPPVTTAMIDIPPKDLVADVRRVVSDPPISLPIVSEHEGTLETGYQSFQGEWHIARHWQERTKYLIRIAPDWNEPTRRSRIDVTAQTQQRAASNQTFEDAPELDRPARAAAILKEIQAGVAKPAPATP